eukprot:6310206-Alexandrium_andersonii.AAC.1
MAHSGFKRRHLERRLGGLFIATPSPGSPINMGQQRAALITALEQEPSTWAINKIEKLTCL